MGEELKARGNGSVFDFAEYIGESGLEEVETRTGRHTSACYRLPTSVSFALRRIVVCYMISLAQGSRQRFGLPSLKRPVFVPCNSDTSKRFHTDLVSSERDTRSHCASR